jgi:hypothetical protein
MNGGFPSKPEAQARDNTVASGNSGRIPLLALRAWMKDGLG